MRRSSTKGTGPTARRVRKVATQLDVPTMMTPAISHLLRFHFVCCAGKVSELINRPVVSLLGTRVSWTSTEISGQTKSLLNKLGCHFIGKVRELK